MRSKQKKMNFWIETWWIGKKSEKAKNVFLALKLTFIGQSDNHIGWATSMLFVTINKKLLEINPWKFGQK